MAAVFEATRPGRRSDLRAARTAGGRRIAGVRSTPIQGPPAA
ncbi:hypothetical protein [Actinomadura physcomitrii]|nr:hypothetical protein [Actinomadura physcomitrii]